MTMSAPRMGMGVKVAWRYGRPSAKRNVGSQMDVGGQAEVKWSTFNVQRSSIAGVGWAEVLKWPPSYIAG
jgi:hypothetical protein